jgi:hypothetical protein
MSQNFYWGIEVQYHNRIEVKKGRKSPKWIPHCLKGYMARAQYFDDS